jgi:hypothetical protein
MRKIEQQMVSAVNNIQHNQGAKGWSNSNTIVVNAGDRAKVFLHGNHIADVFNTGVLDVNTDTLRQWATPTTKSRLRALGANVTTRKGVTYLNNVAI